VITKLNLASDPFRNRTTPYLLSLLLVALAVAGAVLGFAKLNKNNAENEIAKQDIQRMEAEVARLKGEGTKVQQQLTSQQQALLISAHKLVANKSFGWSRLFADLESVLPGSVSASRISVENIYQDGDRIKAELDFSVLSRDYSAVMNMIAAMNNSGLFQAELRGQDLQKNDRFTYTEYTLHLIYTPTYAYSSAAPNDVAQTAQGGDQQ
jgi:Tfp pilus assembly protein PilN